MTALENAQTGVKRVRRSAPKSRNGCITCKIRRVKCDEAKPFCLQCINSRRTCDGYQPRQAKSTTTNTSPPSDASGSERCLARTSPCRAPVPTLAANISEYSSMGFEERRCFHMFHQQVTSHLACSRELLLGSRHILQAARHSPSVRYAAIALGSLHDQIIKEGSEQRHTLTNVFALRHYGKAINSLLSPIAKQSNQDVDVILVACVLFICFELLRGHHGAALSHIRNGAKVLLELEDNKRNSAFSSVKNDGSFVPIERLRSLMEGLDIQASMICNDRLMLKRTANDLECGAVPFIPKSFTSLNEAKTCFDQIWVAVTRFLRSYISEGVIPERKQIYLAHRARYTECVQQWSTVFDSFIRQTDRKQLASNMQLVRSLMIKRIDIVVSLDEDLTQDMTDNQNAIKYDGSYREIVRLAQELLDNSEGHGLIARHFCLEVSIIPSLSIVAHKTHDAELRDKAITLLKASNRQEGLWNSKVVAGVLEKAIELGGHAPTSSTPVSSRFASFSASVAPDGEHASVTFLARKSRSSGQDHVPVYETML